MAKVLMAMSGGIDSTVAALLLKEQGHDIVAITLSLLPKGRNLACSNQKDLEIAAKVCGQLGIEHHTLNLEDAFEDKVIAPFVEAYEQGLTPNPCIECNRVMKFASLYNLLEPYGCDYVASGHYARIEFDENRDRYLLKKGLDTKKDQSYVLYNLTQNQLAHTLFPLGALTKDKVRALAEEAELVNHDKAESQDICFIPDGDYVRFLEEYRQKAYPPGNFVSTNGEVLGQHNGIVGYTIGQRRGLGISGNQRLFVLRINADKNEIVVGDENELLVNGLIADNVNLISQDRIEDVLEVMIRTRYQQKEQAALVSELPEAGLIPDPSKIQLKFTFLEKQKSSAPGQSVVMYQGEVVVGGGRIVEMLEN